MGELWDESEALIDSFVTRLREVDKPLAALRVEWLTADGERGDWNADERRSSAPTKGDA